MVNQHINEAQVGSDKGIKVIVYKRFLSNALFIQNKTLKGALKRNSKSSHSTKL